MRQNVNTLINKYRRLLPLSATIILFILSYAIGAIYLPGMRDKQVFLNLFNQTPYLLVSVIGETLVIISGGIDLSVAGIVPLVTTASASLLRIGWDPWLVMLLMLAIGTAMGAIMGYFITYMKVQPFIGTLAGMWIGRGLAYFISNNSLSIDNRIYELLSRTKILIPGLSDPVTQKGAYITPSVVIGMFVFLVVILIAQYTRFGRTIYAMGGNNGANEQAARLMGLPVNRTKVLVYTLNGFLFGIGRYFVEYLHRIWPWYVWNWYGDDRHCCCSDRWHCTHRWSGLCFRSYIWHINYHPHSNHDPNPGNTHFLVDTYRGRCNYSILHRHAVIFCQPKNWTTLQR